MPIPPHQLNYHHLRYFHEVARHGSLRAAAEKLHVSQPTLSGQIRVLEETLGSALFERSGRGLRLTETGRIVQAYTSEIFGLGSRMLAALDGEEVTLPSRLNVGIADSLPKLVAWRIIRPVLDHDDNLQLTCSEGRSADLLGQLASHRLDVVLADEPAPASLPIKAYSHLLGEAPVVFCATRTLAKKLKPGFPNSLEGAPALLPASRTAWRHQLDQWFQSQRIHPRVAAEFDDAAMLKTAASDGLGFAPIAEPVLDDALKRYDLQVIGRPARCGFACYLITLERTLRNAAVQRMADNARDIMRRPSRKKAK